jgi:hypothetical protein
MEIKEVKASQVYKRLLNKFENMERHNAVLKGVNESLRGIIHDSINKPLETITAIKEEQGYNGII